MKVLKQKNMREVIAHLSKADREVLKKVSDDFVKDRTEDPDERKMQSELFGDDLDIELVEPEVKREAVLRLRFGKVRDIGAEPGEINQKVLTDYIEYFEKGNLEYFQSKKGLIFGFIKKQTFEDCFKMEHDWKVRYYALEEVYLELCKQDSLKNEQQWNINKFVYVQLNKGIRIEFLDTYQTTVKHLMSIEDHREGFASVDRE